MKRSLAEDAEESDHKRARHDASPPPGPAPAPAPLAPAPDATHLPLRIDAAGNAGQAVADAARDDFLEEDEHEVVPPPPPALPLELMSHPAAASAWKAVMEDEMKELFAYPEVKVRVDRVGWTTSAATRLCNTYKCPKEAFVTALWTDKRNSDEYEALTNLDALKGDIAIKTFVVNLVESKALTNYREIQDIMRLLNDRRSAEKFLAAEFDTASGLNDDLAHWMSSQFEVFLTYSHRRKKLLRNLAARCCPEKYGLVPTRADDSSSDSTSGIALNFSATPRLPPTLLPALDAPFGCPMPDCASHAQRRRRFVDIHALLQHCQARHHLDRADAIDAIKKARGLK